MTFESAKLVQFGQQLRAERERRGLTEEALCAVTKVSRRHIEALEAGQWQELPGGVFRKGIVRSYLAAAGLEEAAWMEHFAQTLQDGGANEPDDQRWAEFAENVRRNRSAPARPTRMRWFGILLMLVVLAASGWLAWKYVLSQRMILLKRPAVIPLSASPIAPKGNAG